MWNDLAFNKRQLSELLMYHTLHYNTDTKVILIVLQHLHM